MLTLRSYNFDYGGAKVGAYVTLVNNLKARGVKITQLGSQSHLIVGSTPSATSLASVFSTLTATGVDVAITELDIRMTLPVTDALLAQQKKDYNGVILACLRTPKCIGITIWSYSDYYSWVPSTFSGQVSPLKLLFLHSDAFYRELLSRGMNSCNPSLLSTESQRLSKPGLSRRRTSLIALLIFIFATVSTLNRQFERFLCQTAGF